MCVTLITGCMFAGNTTRAMNIAEQYNKPLYLKPVIDTRYEEDKIVSKLYDLAISSSHGSTRVYIGNKLLPMKRFVADFVGGGIVGMLGSLKKTENLGDKIKVYIDTNMMPKD